MANKTLASPDDGSATVEVGSPPFQSGQRDEDDPTSRGEKPSKPPHVWVPRRILNAHVGHSTRLVYLAIADLCDNRSRILKINKERLAIRCGTVGAPIPSRTLERALADLIRLGFLTVEIEARGSRPRTVKVDEVKEAEGLRVHLGYIWSGHGQPTRHTDAPMAVTGLLAILNMTDFKTGEMTARHAAFASAVPGRKNSNARSRSESLDGPRTSADTFSAWVTAVLNTVPPGTVKVTRTRNSEGHYRESKHAVFPKFLPRYTRASDVAAFAAEAVETVGNGLVSLPGWQFMTKQTRLAIRKNPERWPEPVMELTSRLRDGIQALKETGTRTAIHDVMISPAWLTDVASAIGESGLSLEKLGHVVDFAVNNTFERTNLLGNRHASPASKFREHAARIALTLEFLDWLDQNGHVDYPDDVHTLCESFRQFCKYMQPDQIHEIDWRWRRGANTLLSVYPVHEINDMMEWALKSHHHISDVHMLLHQTHAWVAHKIRRENDFVLWSRKKGREWAKHARAIAPTSTRGGSSSMESGAKGFIDYADDIAGNRANRRPQNV